MRFGLVGPAYKSESPAADAETLVNWYVERMESEGAKTKATLYQRGGLLPFVVLPTAPIRGQLEVNGQFFVASGGVLYEVFEDGTYTSRGSIGANTTPVSMTASPQTLMLISDGIPFTCPIAGGPVEPIDALLNDSGAVGLDHSRWALEWPIEQMDVRGIHFMAGVASIAEVGNGVSFTFNASSLDPIDFDLIKVGMTFTLSGLTETDYNGDWTCTFVNKSNPAAVVMGYFNPTSGIGPDSGGDLLLHFIQIQSDELGVSIPVGSIVEVAACSHGPFNDSYTVLATVSGSASNLIRVVCPIALIGDATAATDGFLITLANTPLKCDFCAGYFILFYADSQLWRISGLFDAYSWDGLDVARIQVFPDNIVSLKVDHNEVWFWGREKTVAYANTGNADFPFEVIQSSIMEQGCAATFSPVQLDNSLFWPGRDDRGRLIAWRANGFLPQRVSTHAVEYLWQGLETEDIESFTYQWFGHSFWVIYFPTAGQTWQFDASTGTWSRLGYWDDGDEEYEALRGRCHSFAFGLHLIGDWDVGIVYVLTKDYCEDNGNPIRLERTCPAISQEANILLHDQVQIDVESGISCLPSFEGIEQTTNPTVNHTNPGSGTFPAGAYMVRIVDDIDGEVTRQTENVGVFIPSTNALEIISGDYPGGNRRIYITNDGWQTAYYNDVGSGAIGLLLFGWVAGSWTAGLPEHNRQAELTLRFSDDNTHTWSNEKTLSCGASGDYNARAVYRRAGKSRRRVYQFYTTDPASFRIIDGYAAVRQGTKVP